MSAPWTICGSCFSVVDVVVTPRADPVVGAGWFYDCECHGYGDDSRGDPSADMSKDTPPPTALDNLALILPILARIADDDSAPATVRAAIRRLMTAASDATPAPADPNQLPLPLGAS